MSGETEGRGHSTRGARHVGRDDPVTRRKPHLLVRSETGVGRRQNPSDHQDRCGRQRRESGAQTDAAEARCGIATLHPAEAQSGVTGGGAEDPDALTILTGYRARVGEATKSIKINLAGIKNPPFDRPESDQGSRDR